MQNRPTIAPPPKKNTPTTLLIPGIVRKNAASSNAHTIASKLHSQAVQLARAL
jgi:hypothetical protein